MIAQPRTNQANRVATRTVQWLPALEQALKSRVGWVDEAISPFAGRRAGLAPRKTPAEPIETVKAA